ncbi:MAG: dUTP diphosphatase [Alphaproteobacteria bacterium]|nr:dUTP diphosphatase [Alphaproteobacteria bacterium]
MNLSIKRLPHAKDLPLPSYATEGSAGLDLLAAIDSDVKIAPGARAAIPCGIAVAFSDKYEGQVRARSGLALNHGVTLLNAPGTIDSDYRGEIKAIMVNLGEQVFTVTRGMKIAQLVLARVKRAIIVAVEDLPDSDRGEGGFGSTGSHRND